MSARKDRLSVSLPATLSKEVRALARSRGVSIRMVAADLIARGLDAVDLEKSHFYGVAARLESSEGEERKRLKEELGDLTFGPRSDDPAPVLASLRGILKGSRADYRKHLIAK